MNTEVLINNPFEGYLIILCVVVILFFLLVSLFLNYHWKEYSYNPQGTKLGKIIYYSGAVFIIAMVIFGLLLYVSR